MSHKYFVSSGMGNDEKLEDVAMENFQAALLWPWLIGCLDDWGRARVNPRRMKLEHFAALPLTAEAIDEAIQLFARHGLIKLYVVEDTQYMAIDYAKWWKYQTHIHKWKRQGDKSKVPCPPWDMEKFESQEGMKKDPKKTTETGESQTSSEPRGESDELTTLNPEFKEVASVFQQEGFGQLSPATTEQLGKLYQKHGKEWLIKAIKESVRHGVKTIVYIEGILNKSQERGSIQTGTNKSGDEISGHRNEALEAWNRTLTSPKDPSDSITAHTGSGS